MTEEQRLFLQSHGAGEVRHSSAELLSHLRGTEDLLRDFGARHSVCAAGLMHSVYGTESFQTAILPIGLRRQARAVFGDEAEALAYVFGAMVKSTFYAANDATPPHRVKDRFTGETLSLSAGEYGDVCNMIVANWLEQRPRVAPEHQFIRRKEFKAMRKHLLPMARAAIDEAYGFRA